MSEYTYESGFKWNDPFGDEDTQEILHRKTVVGLEEALRLNLEWERMHYCVAKDLGLNYKALVNMKQDTEAVKYLRNTAYFVGGERGQRIGRERARRMIQEAYQFAELSLAQYASLLDDGEGQDE